MTFEKAKGIAQRISADGIATAVELEPGFGDEATVVCRVDVMKIEQLGKVVAFSRGIVKDGIRTEVRRLSGVELELVFSD